MHNATPLLQCDYVMLSSCKKKGCQHDNSDYCFSNVLSVTVDSKSEKKNPRNCLLSGNHVFSNILGNSVFLLLHNSMQSSICTLCKCVRVSGRQLFLSPSMKLITALLECIGFVFLDWHSNSTHTSSL